MHAGIEPTRVIDAGDGDFGTGLLLGIHAAIAALEDGDVLEIRGGAASVTEDLAAWCVLTGNALVGQRLVRKGGVEEEPDPPALGSRLWLYTNFDCNLACDYCCAESSPRAAARRMPVAMAQAAVEEFVSRGGREVMITGGEPFLHPDLAAIVTAVAGAVPVTILTNGMVFHSGSRRRALEALSRDAVTVQISLDSSTPALHDRHRGEGSFSRARAGIALARSLGFTVRIAATVDTADAHEVGALRDLLTAEDIEPRHQIIRRVARQGFATDGVLLTRDDLHPEPTVAVDGVWWHPVGITDGGFRVTAEPLPVGAAIDEIRRILDATAAQRDATRRTFRCA